MKSVSCFLCPKVEEGERLSRKQHADLNLHYVIRLNPGVDPEPSLNMLNALDIVENTYPEPIAEPANLNAGKSKSSRRNNTRTSTPTPDFESQQAYLSK